MVGALYCIAGTPMRTLSSDSAPRCKPLAGCHPRRLSTLTYVCTMASRAPRVVFRCFIHANVLQIEIYPMTPYRNTSYEFQQYQLGVGGPCEHFVPPAGKTSC